MELIKSPVYADYVNFLRRKLIMLIFSGANVNILMKDMESVLEASKETKLILMSRHRYAGKIVI
jgi:hypothetical protein